MTAAVVLAAGLSRRMGTDKLQKSVGGKPMIQYALDLARALPVQARLLVTNQQAIVSIAPDFQHVPSLRAAAGMGFSVAEAAKNLPKMADFCVFLCADQPLLQPKTVQILLDCAIENNCIAAPRVNGKPCAPCVFPRRFFAELAALTGDTGGRRVWKKHPEETKFCDFADETQFWDADTPAALAAVARRAKRSPET